MTDAITTIVDACRTYWREVGLARSTVDDMSRELESHLREAADHGRAPEQVVGDDLPSFAAEWAREHRAEHARPLPSWDSVQSRLEARPATRHVTWVAAVSAVALIATIAFTTGKESFMDNEVWRWVWTVMAVVLSIGEIFSAGFFLLPFGIGAALAAVTAWIGLHGAVQWVAFFAGTAVSMLYLRRFIRLQDTENGLTIGPSRYVGMSATVLEKVDMDANTGMIRVEAEEWRAITDGDPIPAGAKVEVTELRGTRLVVAKVE